jgi:hypothetical protein
VDDSLKIADDTLGQLGGPSCLQLLLCSDGLLVH